MKLRGRPSMLWWIVVGAIFWVVVIHQYANASGTDIIQDVDVNTGASASTSVVTGDSNGGSFVNDSLALSLMNSLGDVDINDCLGSIQWNTPLFGKQKLVLNKWCAAETYDAKGMFQMAGRMRCQIPAIAKLFPTTESCLASNIMRVVVSVEPAPPSPVDLERAQHDEDDDDALRELMAEIKSMKNAQAREAKVRERYLRNLEEQRANDQEYAAEQYEQALEIKQ